ncbi:MAG: hypothetical protein WD512_18185, partial [Candidatus Paceibacterota bacterium]
ENQTTAQLDNLIKQYIDEMTPMEKIIMELAEEHLETSFCIEHSVGFVTWIREKNIKINK